jgi:hypothetical protein
MSLRVATRLHRFLCGVRPFCGLQSKQSLENSVLSRKEPPDRVRGLLETYAPGGQSGQYGGRSGSSTRLIRSHLLHPPLAPSHARGSR